MKKVCNRPSMEGCQCVCVCVYPLICYMRVRFEYQKENILAGAHNFRELFEGLGSGVSWDG